MHKKIWQQTSHSFNQFDSELLCSFSSSLVFFCSTSFMSMASTSTPRSCSELTITVEHNPSKSRLAELGINSWPKWVKFIKSLSFICFLPFLYIGCQRISFLDEILCIFRWGCPPGKYMLKFDAQETCYFLRGKVKVYPKGSSESVKFGVGDLVTIPKGLSCTWEVSVAVDKHYKFESSSTPTSSSKCISDIWMLYILLFIVLNIH